MTAEDFTNLHLQYLSTQAEGELPATIEHDFHNGRMVDHYFVTPSPNFWQDEAIKALEGVTGIMFLQQPDGAPLEDSGQRYHHVQGGLLRFPRRRVPPDACQQQCHSSRRTGLYPACAGVSQII